MLTAEEQAEFDTWLQLGIEAFWIIEEMLDPECRRVLTENL